MMYNYFNITIFDIKGTKTSFIDGLYKHNIAAAVMGDNSSECYVYQVRCYRNMDFIENFIGRIQRYHNGILRSQITLNTNNCVAYYSNKKIIYSKNKLLRGKKKKIRNGGKQLTNKKTKIISHDTTTNNDICTLILISILILFFLNFFLCRYSNFK